jgi:hypothetical protein
MIAFHHDVAMSTKHTTRLDRQQANSVFVVFVVGRGFVEKGC